MVTADRALRFSALLAPPATMIAKWWSVSAVEVGGAEKGRIVWVRHDS